MPATPPAPVGPSDDSADNDQTVAPRADVPVRIDDDEEWVRVALGSARVGVWELDLLSDALKWSGTAALAFGLNPENAPTSGRAFIEIVHADDRPALAHSHARAIRDRLDVVTEFRTIAADGSIRWIRAHGRVTYDPDGAPRRMLGVNIDITDRKLLEEKVQAANRQAEHLRILKATMRTVQDIVGNALMSLQFLHLETEPCVSTQALTLFDQIVAETADKLRVLSDVEHVIETEMAAGAGIKYAGGTEPDTAQRLQGSAETRTGEVEP